MLRFFRGSRPSIGVTCGCVREPGSLTLPFGVGCLHFSTKSKNANTPSECAGRLLRAFFAVRKQSPPQVKAVEAPGQIFCRRETTQQSWRQRLQYGVPQALCKVGTYIAVLGETLHATSLQERQLRLCAFARGPARTLPTESHR